MNQPCCVRNKRFFICDYTGAPILKRYFVPFGKTLKGKQGSYLSLPVCLRHVWEEQGGETKEFLDIKKRLEMYFNQPNIPLAPKLEMDRVPLSKQEAEDYLLSMEMGMAWLAVPRAQDISEIRFAGDPDLHKKRSLKEFLH